jgi:hypothetical protein
MAKTYKYNKDEDYSSSYDKKTKIKNETNNRITRVMKSHKGQKAFLDLYYDDEIDE